MADSKRSRAALRGVRTKRRNAAVRVGRGLDAAERDPDAQLMLNEAHGGVLNLASFQADMRGCAPHATYSFHLPKGHIADGLTIQTAHWRRSSRATPLLQTGETLTVTAGSERLLMTVETSPAQQTVVTDNKRIRTRTCTGLLRCTLAHIET